MTERDATEQAYKNGFREGYRKAIEDIKKLLEAKQKGEECVRTVGRVPAEEQDTCASER